MLINQFGFGSWFVSWGSLLLTAGIFAAVLVTQRNVAASSISSKSDTHPPADQSKPDGYDRLKSRYEDAIQELYDNSQQQPANS